MCSRIDFFWWVFLDLCSRIDFFFLWVFLDCVQDLIFLVGFSLNFVFNKYGELFVLYEFNDDTSGDEEYEGGEGDTSGRRNKAV